MSDTIRMASARRQSRATAHAGWLGGGTLRLYTVPVPDHSDTALTTQTLLAEFPLPDPIGDVTDGVIIGAAIDSALNLATGTVAFGRVVDAAEATVGDYDAGIVGSQAAIELDDLDFVAGSLSTIISFVITEG